MTTNDSYQDREPLQVAIIGVAILLCLFCLVGFAYEVIVSLFHAGGDQLHKLQIPTPTRSCTVQPCIVGG